MKKTYAIFFLIVYLFSATEFTQFLKIPLLIEHYVEHKEEDKSINFWQFLYVHYAHGIVKDADYEKDMKLPFKTHDNCNHISVLIIPNISHHFSLANYTATFVKEQQLNSYHPTFLGSDYLNSIWQPPKFV